MPRLATVGDQPSFWDVQVPIVIERALAAHFARELIIGMTRVGS